MATLPTQRTWTTSEGVTAAYLNSNVRDAVNFFLNAPSARVYNSFALSIPHAVSTLLSFDSERYDNDTIHTGASPGRLTCQTAGVYAIYANIAWAANVTGIRGLSIQVNGNVIATQDLPAGSGQAMSVATQWKMAVGDYVEIAAYQASGGNLNVNQDGTRSPEAGMTWISAG